MRIEYCIIQEFEPKENISSELRPKKLSSKHGFHHLTFES
jgi:hypothetical protein